MAHPRVRQQLQNLQREKLEKTPVRHQASPRLEPWWAGSHPSAPAIRATRGSPLDWIWRALPPNVTEAGSSTRTSKDTSWGRALASSRNFDMSMISICYTVRQSKPSFLRGEGLWLQAATLTASSSNLWCGGGLSRDSSLHR